MSKRITLPRVQGRTIALVLLSALLGGCGVSATPSPTPSFAPTPLAIPAAALAEAVRFRIEFGLQSDDAFVREVFANPQANSVDFGVPLLPTEVAELHRRAAEAADVAAVVRAYGQANPETFAGDYIDPKTGTVYGLFVGDISTPRVAIEAQLSPAARFVAVPAKHTLRQLDALLAAASSDGNWFASVAAPLRAGSVKVEENVVWLFLGGIPTGGLDVLYVHFGADASILNVTVEPDTLAALPRGSVNGIVVDQGGGPVVGRNLEVIAIGDISGAEPDGGVGIGTNADGTFVIPKLAAMGWEITIRDPVTGVVLGEGHAVVTGGHTTNVQIKVAT